MSAIKVTAKSLYSDETYEAKALNIKQAESYIQSLYARGILKSAKFRKTGEVPQ